VTLWAGTSYIIVNNTSVHTGRFSSPFLPESGGSRLIRKLISTAVNASNANMSFTVRQLTKYTEKTSNAADNTTNTQYIFGLTVKKQHSRHYLLQVFGDFWLTDTVWSVQSLAVTWMTRVWFPSTDNELSVTKSWFTPKKKIVVDDKKTIPGNKTIKAWSWANWMGRITS